MFLRWIRNRRRARLLQRPCPEDWTKILRENVVHYARLTPAEQATLRDKVQVFVAEKNWEGCGGLRMTDEVKVTVAAQACLLVLRFDDEYFDAVPSILVYPDAYTAPDQTLTRGGVVLKGDEDREGEAWYRGPVVLSWADAQAGARGEDNGHNLVLHEFAHQLDMHNGHEMDGTPHLASRAQYGRWHAVMTAEYKRLERDCRGGRSTLLDCYGTTNMAEFFAVATECFFEQPCKLSQRHPQLYALLRDYFQQDWAARVAGEN